MDRIAWRAEYAEGLKIGRQRACPAQRTGLDLAGAYALLAELPGPQRSLRAIKARSQLKRARRHLKPVNPRSAC